MRNKYLILVFTVFVSFVFGDVFIDDFDDGIIDSSFWSIQSSPGTNIAEFGGVCRMRVNAGGCGGLRVCSVTKRMKMCIIGDFEAYIKFDIVDIGDGDITPLMLMANNDCVRQRLSVSWAAHHGRFTYRAESIDTTAADTVWTILDSRTTSEREGYLRMVHSGDWWHFYYYESFWGGWTIIDSVEMHMEKTWLAMHVQNQGSHETIDAAIDSFYLEYDSLYYSECEPPEPTQLCMNETATILLEDEEGVYAPSIEFTIDDVPYEYGYPGVSFAGGELTYDPSGAWLDGEMHEFCLTHVEDIVGNTRVEDTCWSFITDLTAPIVSEFSPAAGDTIYNFTPTVSCRIVDTWHDVDVEQTNVKINYFNFYLSDSRVDWDGTYARVDLEDIGLPLRPGDSVEVCISAYDDIYLCTSNDSLICWTFITGDSIRPEIGHHFPDDTIISSCDDQTVAISLTDNIEIDTMSIDVSAGGNSYSYPSQMSFMDDTLYFTPDFAWQHGLNEICIESVYDIWENEPTDLPHCFDILIDLEGPIYENLMPAPGEIVSTTHPMISCTIDDSISSVLPDSFAIIFEDTIEIRMDSTSSLFTFSGDSFIFDSELAGLHFSGGNNIEVCIHSFDTPDLCSPNLGDTCWVFSIASGGPEAYEILPYRDEHTSCDDQEIRIIIEDVDGINWNSIILSVAGSEYDIFAPELSYSGDTLIFEPSTMFTHGQIVEVDLVNAQDSLDNPLSSPLVYSFIVDLMPPGAFMAYPAVDQIVRHQQPEIEIEVEDDTTPILADSTIISVLDSVFTISHPAMRFESSGDGSSGSFFIDLSESGLRLISGDTVWVRTMRLCDAPDICTPNCSDSAWYFRQEHDRSCLAVPNPFTPNSDAYNDRIYFEYPGQDLDDAEIVIYNLRGFEICRKTVPASINEYDLSRTWDGLSTGKQMQKPGQYLYMILVDGEVVCEGSITLVR
ncbi:MAG: gliding motility-associated C-terminal domain-containing protein [Candidatus Zixiibacteriota bacterium]